jgi:hypothetical protein
VCPTGVSPTNCTIIMTRSTGLETIRDSIAYPTTIKQAGYLVAWSVGLTRLSTNNTTAAAIVTYLNSKYGGTSQPVRLPRHAGGVQRCRGGDAAGAEEPDPVSGAARQMAGARTGGARTASYQAPVRRASRRPGSTGRTSG